MDEPQGTIRRRERITHWALLWKKKIRIVPSVFNGPTLATVFIYFQAFQSNNTNLQQINVENVHPVSGAGIRTYNLLIMSLLP